MTPDGTRIAGNQSGPLHYQFAVDSLYNRRMSETLEAPTVKASHRGCAPHIRALATRFPEMPASAIAETVGCTTSNVYSVLDTFLAGTSREALEAFQANKADVYDALQLKLLGSLTEEKIANSKVMEAVTGAAILEDKARLVRGQATGINVSVLMDVVEAIRLRGNQPVVSAPISEGIGG